MRRMTIVFWIFVKIKRWGSGKSTDLQQISDMVKYNRDSAGGQHGRRAGLPAVKTLTEAWSNRMYNQTGSMVQQNV